jgi:cobalt/nickel transport system permease protein
VAILVGPWVGSLCIAIVLVVQALLFADGGLTALGTNITNMALVGHVHRLRSSRTRCAASPHAPAAGPAFTSFVAALINTVVAALAFVVEYAVGGAGGAGLGTVLALMVGCTCSSASARGSSPRPRSAPSRPSAPTSIHLLRGTRPAVTLRTPREGVR